MKPAAFSYVVPASETDALDALAPDVTQMDEKEQDFHVETLKYLETLEQSFQ